MSQRALICFAFAVLAAASQASSAQYYGLYVQGVKVGYAVSTHVDAHLNGRKVTKVTNISEMPSQPFTMHSCAVNYYDTSGRPIRCVTKTFMATGEIDYVEDYGKSFLRFKAVEGGKTTIKKVAIPKDGTIVDPSEKLMKSKAGTAFKAYAFDESQGAFRLVTATYKGMTTIEFKGKKIPVKWVETKTTYLTASNYYSRAGVLIKTSIFGMEQILEDKRTAMSGISKNGSIDFANDNLLRRTVRTSARPEHELLGAVLRNLREKAGLTQREVASRLGRTQSFVWKVETGAQHVDIATLMDFACVLGASAGEIVNEVALAVRNSEKPG